MEGKIFDPSINVQQIEELRGEQNYFNEVKRLGGKGKIIKLNKKFPSKIEALDFIKKTPGRVGDELSSFIPKTEWVVRDEANDMVGAIAVTEEVEGTRLDKVDLNQLEKSVIEQLDEFVSLSLRLYEENGVCPGINLKNFVISKDRKLFYVDSEPYPPYGIKPFEMAHAREQRLLKLFGQEAEEKLPKTWGWIKKHEAVDYREAKREKRALKTKVIE